MTREEAGQICKEVRHCLWILDEQEPIWDKGTVSEALNMAIEALEEKYPCGLCKYYEDDDWGVCQYCPAEPKGGDDK